jgi:hypothetical protein
MLPCQREMIPTWIAQGQKIKDIALRLGVTYHNVYYIANPDKLEKNRENSSRKYDKDYRTKSTARYRNKKREIEKGLITYNDKV